MMITAGPPDKEENTTDGTPETGADRGNHDNRTQDHGGTGSVNDGVDKEGSDTRKEKRKRDSGGTGSGSEDGDTSSDDTSSSNEDELNVPNVAQQSSKAHYRGQTQAYCDQGTTY